MSRRASRSTSSLSPAPRAVSRATSPTDKPNEFIQVAQQDRLDDWHRLPELAGLRYSGGSPALPRENFPEPRLRRESRAHCRQLRPLSSATLTLFGTGRGGGTLFQQPQYLLLLRLGLGRAGAAPASVVDRKKHWGGAAFVPEYGIGAVFEKSPHG
jgi:hypothetical protein